MAQITINIPDAIAPRVVNAFAERYGYQPTLEDGEPNPQTKAQFAKQKLIEYIKNTVRRVEIQKATETAAGDAGQSVDTDIALS